MTDNNTDTVENRSEIVFLYDAVDANPNGNPLSGANRPRVDPHTRQAIVTDVRLKRYLRDQLDDDGHGVYIRNVKEDGHSYTRDQLLADRISDLKIDEIDDDDLADAVYGAFLENSADVRYFGATMSVSAENETVEAVEDHIPDHFTGPVQFSPGKSLHAVNENEEYNSLTSVIATQEQKQQGGFDLDDHRLQYALIGFHGLVDEHGAEDTYLSETDVRRLDTLCWRSIKNQTISRSKVGQEPRMYMRVEYDGESHHIGGLTHDLELDEEETKPDEELRTIRDLTLDVDEIVDRIGNNAELIDTVHVVASGALQISRNGEKGGPDVLYGALRDAVGDENVRIVEVYEEYEETLPAATE